MGKLSKRTEWSLVAGVALNSINNKTAGNVQSTLITNTDIYEPDYTAVIGAHALPTATPAAPYSGPSYTTDGTKQVETTVPISAVPIESITGAQSEGQEMLDRQMPKKRAAPS